ncbi:MAG: imidazolonepropionase, partial [Alphaproteobacteria bacterium]
MPDWDDIWLGANLATMRPGSDGYGAIEDGALGVAGGRIAWVGPRAMLPGRPEALAHRVHDVRGGWITPALIDCHTHLVYAGDRAAEFEMRLEGASYEDIARAGGGILATVRATRAASLDELAAAAALRLEALIAEGVTVVEIKSGYGLDLETEARMLAAARRLGELYPVRVMTTFLGAHAVPPEYAGRGGDYIAWVADEVLPEIHRRGLADAVDAFLERIAFSAGETERVFRAARSLGLPVKLHAEQLSDQG